MKGKAYPGFLVMLIMLVSLAACSGSSESPTQYTRAVVTISQTSSLSSGIQIYGARATVNLPQGVTVKASPSSANPAVMVTDTGVVSPSGQAAGAETVLATYVPASSTSTTNKVELYIAKSSGFPQGEFVTVNCDITEGSFPEATDFTVTDFEAFDQNGASITGLTVGYTAEIL
jgi:hypothetical protein